ncbi:PREDICTED: uncharacterized protein LOC105455106 [Wasmannia auropunctata]|uniref:uncharacterized protein LOC105455106 n=1 Tax=Wasmannia auropunctata TaxID=64793 RepID=UPI0005F0A545|nr:PREDICTED: uncharacterized protein LOC105455106 [Wasmannia auropunctata]
MYKNAFESIPRILERNSFHIFSGFIMVVTFILRGPRMRLLQTLLEVSSRLPQESYQNLSRLIHAKDIFGLFFLFVHGSIFYYRMQFVAVLRKIFILYSVLLVFQMDMLYVNCVCILKACFKQINDNLANLRKLTANSELYLLRGTHHEQKNPFLLVKLKVVKKQHLAISNTAQMLKTIFSLQLLSTIVVTFTQIIFNLYFYLVRVQVGVPLSNLEKQLYYELFITSVTYYFTKVLLIVWACETGKNQALEINTTVHDAINNISDKEIKYELQLFALQLMHCKNIFSAKGLNVNATLLTAQINDSLVNLRKLIANGEPYLLRGNYKQKNLLLLMQLKAVKKQHLKISDTVQMLNTIFCLHLQFTTIMSFIEITFNVYFYLVRKVQGDVSLSNAEKQMYYETFIVVGTFHIVKLILIVWACETSKNQAVEINTTVHDAFNSTTNEEIKYELRLFSLQLIHRKNIFSAKGFIVDASLLSTMVGSITTMQSDTYKKILMVYIILLMFQIDMLYMNCVCVLKVCFKQINDYLANLRKLMANGEPYLLKWGTHHEQKNSFLLMELKAVKKQHLAICDTVQMLNTTFCLQLLSTIIMAFIEITFNMYFYLVRKVQGDTSLLSELEKQVYYESFIVFGTHHIMKIVLIAWACETGKNQAIEINTTVNDLHNSTSDEEIKYEIILKLSLRLPQKSYQNLSKLIHTKDIFGLLYIIVQLLRYYMWMQFNIIRKITTLYIDLLEFEINMLYVNCVCVLKACFKQINDSLVNLRVFMTNGELYLSRGPYHELKNPFLLMKLKTLREQHLALSDTVYIESFIIISTYCIMKLLLIIWACQTAKNQAMEINTTVLDVYNCISDKEIKYELQLFSLQLMHHKIIFSTTVFNVDATLFVTIIGEACFKQINDSLVNLRELMANGELYILRESYHKLKNPFLLMELKALKEQHLALSHTVQIMKTTFSLQLISTIIMTFIEITLNLYFYLTQVIKEAVNMSYMEKQLYTESFIFCIIYETTKLLCIIWACQTAKNQAMNINTTVLEMFNSINDKEIKYEADVIRKIFHIYVMLLDLQIGMLYVNCVCVLKACFKQINDNLVNLRRLTVNDELYLLRKPYYELENPLLLMELKALKQQHLALSGTVHMMKTTFSLHLISTITGTFIGITLNLYFYLMQVVQEAVIMSNHDKQLYSVSRITIIIYEIIKLLLIIWACQTAKDQSMKINTTVLVVFNSISDKEIKYEMMGFIVTYLLILIQFMFMSVSCDGKT